MTLIRLRGLWVEFEQHLAEPLAKPRLRILPLSGGKLGEYSAGVVTLTADAGDWWAFHEFAHHLWHTRRIRWSVLGVRFLLAARLGWWSSKATELFADSVAFLLTGRWRKGWPKSPKAAEVLRVLLREDAG